MKTILSFDIGIRTLSYVLMDLETDVCECTESEQESNSPPKIDFQIRAWESIDLLQDNGSSATNCKAVSLQKICEYAIKSLHKRSYLLVPSLSGIVAEAQMTGGAKRGGSIRMKVLSHVILSYYVSHYQTLSAFCKQPYISLVSPKLKLHFAFDRKKNRDLSTYRLRKKTAIAYCQILLNQTQAANRSWDRFFSQTSKQDDLSDCLLQGICHFLLNQKKYK